MKGMSSVRGAAPIAAGLLFAALLALGSGELAAQQGVDVNVTASTDDQTGLVTVEVTVSGLPEGTKWKDIHFHAARDKSFPKLEGGTNVTVTDTGTQATQTWTSKGSGGQHVHVYADGADGFGNGAYRFTLDFSGDTSSWDEHPVTWEATSDGDRNWKTGVLDDNAGDPAPNFPQAGIAVNDSEERTVATGQVLVLDLYTAPGVFAGRTYRIYSSTALAERFDDPLAIGIESQTRPIPASWNLAFTAMTGQIDAQGGATPPPSVGVPNDPALVGESFYVVLAIVDGDSVEYAAAPAKVTIVAP